MTPNFERDSRPTLAIEGIWDNDPDDAGAETFRGIARAFHPTWPGWKIIDEVKARLSATDKETVTAALRHHRELEQLALDFYRERFWNPLRLDEVVDGRISEELFDQHVNLPPAMPGLHLQQSLNALNRNGEIFADLVEDGQIGPATLAALKKYFAAEKYYEEAVHLLVMMLNVKQGAYYFESMRKSPTKEKYARGWFKRVRIAKEAA